MRGQQLERQLIRQRSSGRIALIPFVNAGDPSLGFTWELLATLAQAGVRIVELCTPFPNSITDGPTLRASHQRALDAATSFADVLALLERARSELPLQIVLLADYAHTVRPLGLERFLQQVAAAGASASLVHALPMTERARYLELSARVGLGRIMTTFASSQPATRRAAFTQSEGYAYIVSGFGKTGQALLGSDGLRERLLALREETTKPLAIGFGITQARDVALIRSCGADAVIVGSAITRLLEAELDQPVRCLPTLRDFLAALQLATGCGNATLPAETGDSP